MGGHYDLAFMTFAFYRIVQWKPVIKHQNILVRFHRHSFGIEKACSLRFFPDPSIAQFFQVRTAKHAGKRLLAEKEYRSVRHCDQTDRLPHIGYINHGIPSTMCCPVWRISKDHIGFKPFSGKYWQYLQSVSQIQITALIRLMVLKWFVHAFRVLSGSTSNLGGRKESHRHKSIHRHTGSFHSRFVALSGGRPAASGKPILRSEFPRTCHPVPTEHRGASTVSSSFQLRPQRSGTRKREKSSP